MDFREQGYKCDAHYCQSAKQQKQTNNWPKPKTTVTDTMQLLFHNNGRVCLVSESRVRRWLNPSENSKYLTSKDHSLRCSEKKTLHPKGSRRSSDGKQYCCVMFSLNHLYSQTDNWFLKVSQNGKPVWSHLRDTIEFCLSNYQNL